MNSELLRNRLSVLNIFLYSHRVEDSKFVGGDIDLSDEGVDELILIREFRKNISNNLCANRFISSAAAAGGAAIVFPALVFPALVFPSDNIYHSSKLNDINYGDCWNDSKADIYSGVFYRNEMSHDPWNIPWPDGESLADVEKRVVDCLLELNSNGISLHILCSETVSMVILKVLLNLSEQQAINIKHPSSIVYQISNSNIFGQSNLKLKTHVIEKEYDNLLFTKGSK